MSLPPWLQKFQRSRAAFLVPVRQRVEPEDVEFARIQAPERITKMIDQPTEFPLVAGAHPRHKRIPILPRRSRSLCHGRDPTRTMRDPRRIGGGGVGDAAIRRKWKSPRLCPNV